MQHFNRFFVPIGLYRAHIPKFAADFCTRATTTNVALVQGASRGLGLEYVR